MTSRAGGGRRNWAGNVAFQAARFWEPESTGELRRLLAASGRARILGTGHSFSPLADTTGDQISLARMPPTMEVNDDRRSVRVAAAVRYGELAVTLAKAGLALANLGSLPHIGVAGACATGTHGSGDANGSLSCAVRRVELALPDGSLITVDREQDVDLPAHTFPGLVVGLGAFGAVTHLTLDVVPSFEVRQFVYEFVPFETLLDRLDAVFGAAYSVSAFSGWGPRLEFTIWLKQRVDPAGTGDQPPVPPTWFGARLADGPRHPVPGMPVENCTPQGGVPGPWHERLPHFRMGHTPSSGAELQSEYLVPREDGVRALRALAAVRSRFEHAVQVSELRTVRADDLWLSPSFGRDSLGIHFTWVDDARAVAPAVAAVEEALGTEQARPHWGKIFTLDPAAVAARYPRHPEAVRLAAELDPRGVLRNEMIDRYLPTLG